MSGDAEQRWLWDCNPVAASPTNFGTLPGRQAANRRESQAAALGAALSSGYILVQEDQQPPPLKVMFDSQLEKLGYLLIQMWNYLERYGGRHTNDSLRMNAISVNLEGDAVA